MIYLIIWIVIGLLMMEFFLWIGNYSEYGLKKAKFHRPHKFIPRIPSQLTDCIFDIVNYLLDITATVWKLINFITQPIIAMLFWPIYIWYVDRMYAQVYKADVKIPFKCRAFGHYADIRPSTSIEKRISEKDNKVMEHLVTCERCKNNVWLQDYDTRSGWSKPLGG